MKITKEDFAWYFGLIYSGFGCCMLLCMLLIFGSGVKSVLRENLMFTTLYSLTASFFIITGLMFWYIGNK